MVSRALSLATVMLLIGCFAADKAQAQAQNLEAGKSPSQIFAGTCSACHKSPRGLLKTVPAGSLPGFLRQHYTTSSDMASLLSAFMISNGATDTRYVGTQSKQGKDGKPDAKPEAKPAEPVEHLDRFGHRRRGPPPQEAAKPDAEPREAARSEPDDRADPGRHGRNAKRLARPGEAPDAARSAGEAQAPLQAAGERGPDGRRLNSKQRLTKRGKPGSEDLPKTDAAKDDAAKDDAAKIDAAKTDSKKEPPAYGEPVKDYAPKSDTAKDEGDTAESSKPPVESKSETAKIDAKVDGKTDAPKENAVMEAPATRADPVPPVTPAPPKAPAAASSGSPEPPASPSVSAPPPPPPAPPAAVTASVPPPAPMAPSGPPAPPPISQ